MNCKRHVICIISLTLSLIVTGSCVSKKDYLLKVQEGEKVSEELLALRSEHDKLEGEKEALDKQVIDLQGARDDLEEARTQLQLKNLSLEKEIARLKEENLELENILEAKSDTLSKNIVDLRAHVADLKKENSLLKEENKDLSQNVDNFQDQIESLQSETETLERQREEEMEQMRGTYENLLEDMKSEIEKGEITITQLRGKLKVNMLDEILFDSGKTTIKPQGFEVLERVGSILLNVEDRAINIEGHTDNVPIGAELRKKYPTNWELSAARATNVARYLQEKTGINPSLLSATGYGEYQPVDSNETEEGRAKNRRIEIVLVPKEIAPVSRK
ncbi:MAG: OmpA family protein [Deltaproteobacteria bacterium]|nr:MAG: OmpA family protein [Deltaproteobacteria bacterium]